MGEESHISWTDATFNPWIGCTRVGLGCDGCYAAVYGNRFNVEWGPGKPRRLTSNSNWHQPIAWQKGAAKFLKLHGRNRRVFSASLADVFDNEVPDDWRTNFFDLVRNCPDLDWLIVTKRIGNAAKMLPSDWGLGWPQVTVIATVVNQDEYERDAPKLAILPAWRRGLSVEPMLGPIDFGRPVSSWLHWVICGGESEQPGHKPRVVNPRWVRFLRDQSKANGVAFHFKQWGAWVPYTNLGPTDGPLVRGDHCIEFHDMEGGKRQSDRMVYVGTKNAGRILDGRTWDEFPRRAA